MPDFQGYILRKPKFVNRERTGDEPDAYVRRKKPDELSTEDAEFLKGYVGPDPGQREYLVRPAWNGNFISSTVQESISSSIFGDLQEFRFNADQLEITQVNNVNPTPDDIDTDIGRISYDNPILPSDLPVEISYEVENLKVNWVRNDDIVRFGWSDRARAWTTFVGTPPSEAGTLQSDGSGLQSDFVGDWQGTLQLAIGGPTNPDGPSSPIEATPVSATVFDNYSGPSSVSVDVAINEETGEMLASQSVVSSYAGSEFFIFREDYLNPDDNNGIIGEVGGLLVLNPIPKAANTSSDYRRPLVRIGNRRYLDLEPTDDFSSVSQPFSTDGYWHIETGELRLSSDIENEFGGQSVNYDGVLYNTSPVSAEPRLNVGTMSSSTANPDNTPAQSFSGVPEKYDLDDLYIYDKQRAEFIEFVDVVPEPSEFTESVFLPPDTAEVDRETRTINVSLQFIERHDGNDLYIMNPDFNIENGVSYQWPRSDDTFDGTYIDHVQDLEVSDNVPPAHFLSLNTIPLRDMPGIGGRRDKYFRLQSGPFSEILEPRSDIEEAFHENRIYWSDEKTELQEIKSPTTTVTFDETIMNRDSFSAELDVGGGFQTLNEDEFTLDEQAGVLTFSNQIGPSVASGRATPVSPNILRTSSDLSSVVSNGNFDELTVITDDEAYRVNDITAAGGNWDIEVDPDLSSEALSTNSVDMRLYRGMEDIRRVGFESFDPTSPDVRLFRQAPVGFSDPGFVPDAPSFRFLADDSQHPHVELDRATLGELPSSGSPVGFSLPTVDGQNYYGDESRFKIFREGEELSHSSSSPPPPGSYRFDGANYEIELNASWAHDNAGDRILFVPELKANRSTGPIEVLSADGKIGLPDDLQSSDVFIEVQVPFEEFERTANTLLFERPFQEGERLRAEYRDGDSFSSTESGFQVREELLTQTGQTSFTFGANKELVGSDVQLLVNAFEADSSAANIDTQAKTVELEKDLSNRRVQVAYRAREATGGETTVDLPVLPDESVLRFEEGDEELVLPGDFSLDFAAGDVLNIQDQAFRVRAVAYDGSEDETTVEINQPVNSTIQEPGEILATDRQPVKISVGVDIESVSSGQQEIKLVGDHADTFQQRYLLYLDNDPYIIQGADFDEEANRTSIRLSTELLKNYSSPTVERSEKRVYDPQPQILLSDAESLTTEDFALVKFPSSNSRGIRLEEGTDYAFDDNGRVELDPDNVDLPRSGEIWKLSYTARVEVSPQIINGVRFNPRIRADYAFQITASEENAIAGSTVTISGYTKRPDVGYFRVLPVDQFNTEAAPDVAGTAGGSDMTNESRGNSGQIFEEGHNRDLDRLAVRYLDFFHELATEFEQILETAEGSLIGDRDGRFKFHVPFHGFDPETVNNTSVSNLQGQSVSRGSEHPVKGPIVPYFANPIDPGQEPTKQEIADMDLEDQKNYVRNQIDDIVVTKRPPIEIQLTNTFPFIDIFYGGTLKQTWEPSRFSRLYPQLTSERTVTSPSNRSDFDPTKVSTYPYKFFQDFFHTLGDFEIDDIQSLYNLRERQAIAWIRTTDLEFQNTNNSRDTVKLQIAGDYQRELGQFQTESSRNEIEKGYPEEYRPPFSDGSQFDPDHVSLGRVFVSRTDEEAYEISAVVYAQNMVVKNVDPSNGEIVIQNNPNAGQNFGGGAIFDGIEITDVRTLSPAISSARSDYDSVRQIDGQQATVAVGDTIFGIPPVVVDTSNLSFGKSKPNMPFYKPGFDVGVDNADGRLVNVTLPKLFQRLFGQSPPDSLSFLETEVVRPNPNKVPEKIPALFGGLVDDDEDRKPPLVQPLPDADMPFLRGYLDQIDRVLNNTAEGFVESGTVVNGNTIDIGKDLSAVSPPLKVYDRVLIEGLTSSGENVEFDFTQIDPNDANQIQVGAFPIQAFSMEYTLDAVVDGSGERDASNSQRWNDSTYDFRNFEDGAISGTLTVIGDQSYSITNFDNGFVEVASNIQASGPEDYYITIVASGTTGASINTDLFSINDPGIDFSNVTDTLPTGADNELQVTSASNAYVTGTFVADRGRQDNVAVKTPQLPSSGTNVTISIGQGADEVTGSDGAVDSNQPIFYTPNSIDGVNAGDVLVLPSDNENGGRYRVTQTVEGSQNEIHVDESFREDANLPFPPYGTINWVVRNPRRFNGNLEGMKNRAIQGRPLYIENNDNPPSDISSLLTADVENPSVPYRNRLDRILELLGTEILRSTDGEFQPALTGSGNTLQDSTQNFATNGVEVDDYVVILKRDNANDDQNRGFYKVTDLEADELHVDGLSVAYQTQSPLQESNFEYFIFRPDDFSTETIELTLDQLAEVERFIEIIDQTIRLTIHDPNDFELNQDRSGQPSDTLLSQVRTDVQDRYNWVSGQNSTNPFLRQEIRRVLSVRENLYDTRFSWISFRVNREDGTLAGGDRRRELREEERAKKRRERRRGLSLEI